MTFSNIFGVSVPRKGRENPTKRDKLSRGEREKTMPKTINEGRKGKDGGKETVRKKEKENN